MGDTKSTLNDRKHTLLHYLCELLESKFTDVMQFVDELSHVEEGAKGKLVISWIVNIPSIRSNLATIRENLKTVKTLLDIEHENKKGKSKISESLEQFYKDTMASFSILETRFKQAESDFVIIVNHLTGNYKYNE